MEKFRAAMIGCGGRAGAHLQKLMSFEDVEIVGFCDKIEERAKGFSEKAGTGKVFTDYRAMLDEVKPQAVTIAIEPCAAHGEIELELVKRNIPFLVEKPMALDIKIAENILKAVTEKGLITSVGFQDRYQDITQDALAFIKGHKVGLAEGSWVGGIPGVWWWRKFSTSGGQVVEQNIHIFDMARQFFGEPESVYCVSGKGIVNPEESGVPGYDVDDYSTAVIKMKSGTVVTLHTGCYIKEGGGKTNGMNIYADDATVYYSLRSNVVLCDKTGRKEIPHTVEQTGIQDRVFIDAVKSGDPSKIKSPYADAIKSLRLCLACNESARTGLPVSL